MQHLPLDRGKIDFVNEYREQGAEQSNLTLWTQYLECVECPYLFNGSLSHGDTVSRLYNSNYQLKYQIWTNGQQELSRVLCQGTITKLFDQTVLQMRISNDNNSSQALGPCKLETIQQGRNNLWPLLLVWGVVLLGLVTFYLTRHFFRRWKTNKNLVPESQSGPQGLGSSNLVIKPPASVIAFRGFAALNMIFVNWGAGQYHTIHYSEWDGNRWGDFVLPLFVFILGATFASSSMEGVRNEPKLIKVIFQVNLMSALRLFLVGIVLNSHENADYRFIRIPGVFQRFAMCHILLGTVHTISVFRANRKSSQSKESSVKSFLTRHLADITPYWLDWIMAKLLCVLYIVLTFLWDYDPENCPRGYLGPGGLHRNASYPSCVGGAANRLDRMAFGVSHSNKAFSGSELYDPLGKYKLRHDPEGLLGVTTCVVLSFVGLQVGKILHCYHYSVVQRLLRLTIWASILALLTLWLSLSELIPINRNLWSLSYVTLAGAACILALTILHLLIDHWKVWPQGRPLYYPGINSLLLFVGHFYTANTMPFFFNYDTSSHLWPLIQNVTGMLMWHGISVYLFHVKYFFKL